MPDRFFKHMLNPWTMGLSCIIWTCLGALLWAIDLPSGLPDDLSDSSPFEPCLGRLYGEPPPRCPWYFRADAVMLRRDRVDAVDVTAHTTTTPGGDILFSTDEFNSPFRAGPRFLLGHTFGDSRWQIDGSYFFIDDWDDTAFSNNSALLQETPGYFLNDSDSSFREFTELKNGELNLRYLVPMPHCCLTPKFIIGWRYMSIDERMDFRMPAQISTPTISTHARNDIFGPQLGGEFYFFAYPHCWIDLSIKGALCDDRAFQETTDTRVGAPSGSWRRSRDATTFVGDLELELVWQITPKLMTRIGYQAIWINNIAMAARNFDMPDSMQIDTTGRAVYHGPHIGLEFDW